MLKSSNLFRLALYWVNYVVVRWQLILTVIVLWLSGIWLKNHYGQDDSNLWIVMYQFLRIIQWTLVGLFAMSLLTALLAWALFAYSVANKRVSVTVQFGDGQKAEAGYVPLVVALQGMVIRPLLGSIRAQLIFSGKKFSDPVILDTDVYKKGAWIRKGIRGMGKTLLHDRGVYDVEKVHVQICDMFNLVALPYTLPYGQQLYTLPREQEEGKVKAHPNTTEEQKHRIDIPKPVEGEHVNYKEFETGDNIWRIVWKIYAKSGQLVVRIPETKDPYASHLYFYASFYENLDLQGGVFDTELLNVYKDKVRTIFEALQKNGYDVRMPQDQEVPKLSGMSDKKNELFQITAANWQKTNSPVVFVNANKAAFVCLSALVPLSEIEIMLRNLPLTTPIVVVKLSDAIPSPFELSWKDLIVSAERQPVDKLKKPWLISPLRQRLQKNEEAIRQILKQRGNGWIVSLIDFTE